MSYFLARYWMQLGVLAVLLGGGWYYGHTRYEAGEAKVRAEWESATKEAGRLFGEALADQQVKLLEADRALTEVRRKTRTTREALDDALATPAGSDWGDTAIPESVRVPLESAYRHGMPGHSPVPDGAVRDR